MTDIIISDIIDVSDTSDVSGHFMVVGRVFVRCLANAV
jgi:hypothetical protein